MMSIDSMHFSIHQYELPTFLPKYTGLSACLLNFSDDLLHSQLELHLSYTVADSGFLIGGMPNHWGVQTSNMGTFL